MNRLRELREKHNYTAQYLADVLNVSIRTYYNIENEISYMSVRMIDKLSKIFNVTSDYLLGLSNFNIMESKEENEKNALTNTLKEIFN